MAGTPLPPKSRDTRVLSTILLLRRLHHELHPMGSLHVVGENSLDATASLALGPKKTGNRIPDFVNTQAIFARALTQALAYPVMAPALGQLFNRSKSSPRLQLACVGKDVVHVGFWSFKQLTDVVAEYHAGNVLIGIMFSDGEIKIAPGPCYMRNYRDGDKLIIMTRKD